MHATPNTMHATPSHQRRRTPSTRHPQTQPLQQRKEKKAKEPQHALRLQRRARRHAPDCTTALEEKRYAKTTGRRPNPSHVCTQKTLTQNCGGAKAAVCAAWLLAPRGGKCLPPGIAAWGHFVAAAGLLQQEYSRSSWCRARRAWQHVRSSPAQGFAACLPQPCALKHARVASLSEAHTPAEIPAAPLIVMVHTSLVALIANNPTNVTRTWYSESPTSAVSHFTHTEVTHLSRVFCSCKHTSQKVPCTPATGEAMVLHQPWPCVIAVTHPRPGTCNVACTQKRRLPLTPMRGLPTHNPSYVHTQHRTGV